MIGEYYNFNINDKVHKLKVYKSGKGYYVRYKDKRYYISDKIDNCKMDNETIISKANNEDIEIKNNIEIKKPNNLYLLDGEDGFEKPDFVMTNYIEYVKSNEEDYRKYLNDLSSIGLTSHFIGRVLIRGMKLKNDSNTIIYRCVISECDDCPLYSSCIKCTKYSQEIDMEFNIINRHNNRYEGIFFNATWNGHKFKGNFYLDLLYEKVMKKYKLANE